MSKVIYKYQLIAAAPLKQTIKLPQDFVVMHVGLDISDTVCLWAMVDQAKPLIPVDIVIVGTGHPVPHVGTFLGTVRQDGFIWHVFTGPGHENCMPANRNFHYLTHPERN